MKQLKERSGKGGAGKKFSVFEITNLKTGRKHYMLSSRFTAETILAKIKTYVDSKTVGGGAKELAQDIDKASKEAEDYSESFDVKEVGKGLSSQEAERRRTELVGKAGSAYNKEVQISK